MLEMLPLYCTLIAFSATAGVVAVQLARRLHADSVRVRSQTRQA